MNRSRLNLEPPSIKVVSYLSKQPTRKQIRARIKFLRNLKAERGRSQCILFEKQARELEWVLGIRDLSMHDYVY